MQTFDLQSGYSFDPHTAVIRSKLGWRMLFMSSDAWGSLQEGLYRKFSTGASVIILEMGFSYGSMLFDSLNKMAATNPESEAPNVNDLEQLMMKTGCGKLTISGDLEKGSRLLLVAKSCVFCEGKNAVEYQCNFLRGIMLGLSTGLYGKQYKSVVDCSREVNGHVCKIDLVGK